MTRLPVLRGDHPALGGYVRWHKVWFHASEITGLFDRFKLTFRPLIDSYRKGSGSIERYHIQCVDHSLRRLKPVPPAPPRTVDATSR